MCDPPRPLMPTTATRTTSLAPLTWDQERGESAQAAAPASEDFKKLRRERGFIGWRSCYHLKPGNGEHDFHNQKQDAHKNWLRKSFSLCFCARCAMNEPNKSVERQTMKYLAAWIIILAGLVAGIRASAKDWVVYEGKEGPGRGKQIVFITGDEEYRSEEAMPMLAKVLAVRHGFKCTVLFPINPADGTIDPNNQTNIVGLDALTN